jgi:metal-responsive CopG/Arc/MetJ family transcriptional regulator
MKEACTRIQKWRQRTDMQPLQIYLSPWLKKRLDYACEKTGLNRSELIRQLLREIADPDFCRNKAA